MARTARRGGSAPSPSSQVAELSFEARLPRLGSSPPETASDLKTCAGHLPSRPERVLKASKAACGDGSRPTRNQVQVPEGLQQ